MIDLKIRPDGILYFKFMGDVSLFQMKDFLVSFSSNKDYPDHLRLLYDFTESNLLFQPDDIGEVLALANKVVKPYASVKTAFLVNSPLPAAYSFIAIDQYKNQKQKRKVFTTLKVSINWLEE